MDAKTKGAELTGCRCRLPSKVFTALTKAGVDTLGQAAGLCPVRFGLCDIRRAYLSSIFAEDDTP
jgi:hypothetical protein